MALTTGTSLGPYETEAVICNGYPFPAARDVNQEANHE